MEFLSHPIRTTTIENCFVSPARWDDKSKAAYTEWHARLPENHPSKSNPTPWAVATD